MSDKLTMLSFGRGLKAFAFISLMVLLGTEQKVLPHESSQYESSQLSLIEVLNEIPLGAKLVQLAYRSWKVNSLAKLAENIKWGESSRTDTLLTRHFNATTGEEERESQITIYLKKDQSETDLILDLAHELVHATSRPSFDPYDSTLTPGNYIYAALEGNGGEVDAVAVECGIAVELQKKHQIPLHRCEGYLESDRIKKVSRNKIKKDFYRVGIWKSDLEKLLGEEVARFPLLSSETPALYSSTGRAPYPLSLWREFEEITQAACNNTRRRMQSVTEKNATLAGFSSALVQKDVQQFILKRCQ